MKKLVLGLAVLGLVFLGKGSQATTPKLDKIQLAKTVVHRAVKDGSNKDLKDQIDDLINQGLKPRYSRMDTALLHGQCGFAGCDYRVLVAIPFESAGANTRTESIVLIVSANDYLQSASIRDVLEQKDVVDLFD